VLKETLIVSAGQRNIMTIQTVAGDHTAYKESGFLMKGRLDLKKIVILTDHPERHDMLIACLRILFPECEVLVKIKRNGVSEDVQTDSEICNSVFNLTEP
jgi:hypothetical protein